MYKKNHFLWVALSMLIIASIALSGCAAPPAEPAVEEPAVEEPAKAEEPAAEEPAAEEPAEAEEPTEPLTIALLTTAPVNDGSFAQVYYEALVAVDEYFGDAVNTTYVEYNEPSEEAVRTMEQLIADGADMIIDAATLLDYREEVAEAHPEVAFLAADDVFLENEAIFFYDTSHIYYLQGLAGGLLSETGQLGWMDAFPAPWVNVYLNAYAMGAQSVNPDATVTAAYIGSYYDPTASRQAAEALISSGVDYISGTVGNDTAIALAEEKGVLATGLDMGMSQFGPQGYAMTVTHSFVEPLKAEVQNLLDGTWEGNMEWRSVGPGPNMDIDWGENVPQDVIDQVEAVFEDMVGGWTPFVGPIEDSEGNVVIPDGEIWPIYPDQWWGVEWVVSGVIQSE